jgi:hypothetical protein
MNGVVFGCWLLAAIAPLLGMRWALRKGLVWPLPLSVALGALPIAVIAVLASTLPQG